MVLASALLAIYQDLQTIILDVGRRPEYDLSRFGMRFEPLVSLNAPSPSFIRVIRSILDHFDSEFDLSQERLLEALRKIQRARLLGRETAGKMAVVREITGHPLRTLEPHQIGSQLVALRRRIRFLLRQQAQRLQREADTAGVRSRLDAVRAMITSIQEDVPSSTVKSQRVQGMFLNYPELAVAVREAFLEATSQHLLVQAIATIDPVHQFCLDQADLLAQLIGRHLAPLAARDVDRGVGPLAGLRSRKRIGIEATYVPREEAFFFLGDLYGDCTAHRPRSQVDLDVTNIHETVYSWILDPFYRVLEVTVDGEAAVKGHIVPLLLHGRPVLYLDAVEAVPRLRETVRGHPNSYLSPRMYDQRRAIFQTLLETVLEIADRMGAPTVLVDRFSNCDWIRRELEVYETDFHHVDDVRPLFGTRPVRALLRELLGDQSAVFEEIQAANPGLHDQGLHRGFKEAAILRGDPSENSMPLRGP